MRTKTIRYGYNNTDGAGDPGFRATRVLGLLNRRVRSSPLVLNSA